MGYFINFIVEPDIENGKLLYNRDDFTAEPVKISVPDLCRVVEAVSSGYQRVEVMDPMQAREEFDDETDSPEDSGRETDHAYLINTKDFGEEDLNWLLASLIQYLEDEVQSMQQEDKSEEVLQPEWGPSFSGFCEVSDLRNLLTTYVGGSDGGLRDGYLYIIEA